MFAKLFSSITESSLWSEPKEVRLLFVTMLAKADQTGFVEASIPGLARVANLTVDETIAALECLKNPDPYSKNPDNEGRRVICVPGGFMLLNYEDYRSRRSQEERREYMREYMREYRSERKQDVNKVNRSKPQLSQAETEADAETETDNNTSVGGVEEPKSKGPANAIAEAFMAATRRVCYVTPKRKQAVQARWKDPFWRENWQAALERVGQSPFCNGKGERGWKMDLDFFLKPDTVAQVMEGKYDAKPSMDSTDYESHPEWQEILKILRKYGRDEMTDQQEWRAKNMTQAQKEARKVAFRRWEELEVYDDRQRKEAAKKYITELNRLISEGVPHK